MNDSALNPYALYANTNNPTGLARHLLQLVKEYDVITYHHSVNVGDIALRVGREFGLSDKTLHVLWMASVLHDIGKINIQKEILNKPGSLSATEYEHIQTHVQIADDFYDALGISKPISTIISQHHERLDGTGYPLGLQDEEIVFEAKIIAVADCLDAMTARRPYREPLGLHESIAILEDLSESQLDRSVVNVVKDLHEKDSFLKTLYKKLLA
ncbi:HD domain-containing phosphohydrolase [Neptuniibacter sp.]|uniref:HD-GYP domain-containing protein n=1 Tax=Neptuniibacter sp. TaxID=1962643 RepID=UPI00262CE031|nr:HD domain-containing phosphohydrolase [Neptuniibacter sp.]MCP4597125.1 HD domain-containing protein [Neptuniibacter sp.]